MDKQQLLTVIAWQTIWEVFFIITTIVHFCNFAMFLRADIIIHVNKEEKHK